MEQDENIIAEKIKNFRKAKNLSQKELSERSGINLSIIKKYETGYRNPKPEQLIKIANALEISSVELLPIEISNVNDILALLMKIEENTPLNWSYEKDEEGKYIPGTIRISFKDNRIEEALIELIETKEKQKEMQNDIAKHELFEQLDIEHVSFEDKVRLENKFKMLLEYFKRN